MKNNKGITLIALVITIIVLLILAGVSIAMLTGENGLIAKAIAARDKTEEAKLDEEEKLSKLNEKIGNYVTNRDGSITIDSNTLNQMIEEKVNEKMYSPTIFHGNVVTNTMPASNNSATVNTFTVSESGKYVINYLGKLYWNTSSVFGVVMLKGSEHIAYNMYSNNLEYSQAGLNVTAIEELNEGEVISILLYQYNNGSAGQNNLTANDLQLIKVGN